MTLFIFILLLLIGAVLLTRLAREFSVPYPSLLALGGALLALVPGVPNFSLEPDLVLAIFVAPVLLDAAYDISLRDLRDNRIPIITLVLVAVGLTHNRRGGRLSRSRSRGALGSSHRAWSHRLSA